MLVEKFIGVVGSKEKKKIGYRLVRKQGNQYNRRIRRCKSDDYKNKRYMYVKTVS